MKRIGPPKKWTRHRIYDVLFQSSVKALHVSYFLLTGLFIVQVVGYVKGKPIEILSTNTNPPHQVFCGSIRVNMKDKLNFLYLSGSQAG